MDEQRKTFRGQELDPFAPIKTDDAQWHQTRIGDVYEVRMPELMPTVRDGRKVDMAFGKPVKELITEGVKIAVIAASVLPHSEEQLQKEGEVEVTVIVERDALLGVIDLRPQDFGEDFVEPIGFLSPENRARVVESILDKIRGKLRL